MKARKVTKRQVLAAHKRWKAARDVVTSVVYLVGEIDAALDRYMLRGYLGVTYDLYPRNIGEVDYKNIKKEYEERGFFVTVDSDRKILVCADDSFVPKTLYYIAGHEV